MLQRRSAPVRGEAVYDRVVGGVAEAARHIKEGPGDEPDSQMGPLISRRAIRQGARIPGLRAAAGANVAVGGGRQGERGYFVKPTILTNTTPTMNVEREEISARWCARSRLTTCPDFARGQRHQLRTGGQRVHTRHLEGLPHRETLARG